MFGIFQPGQITERFWKPWLRCIHGLYRYCPLFLHRISILVVARRRLLKALCVESTAREETVDPPQFPVSGRDGFHANSFYEESLL